MPLPRFIAQLNKRYTNQLIEPIVRRLPGYTLVSHTGRVSGQRYSTPVYTFEATGAETNQFLVVALTYGPLADWTQNVIATGGTLTRQGAERPIDSASIVNRQLAWPHLPWFVRIALRALRVTDFMLLHTSASC